MNVYTLIVFQSKILGIGFLKIHAPWNVLCREAEFMKLKMPTKKVPAFGAAVLFIVDYLIPAAYSSDVK